MFEEQILVLISCRILPLKYISVTSVKRLRLAKFKDEYPIVASRSTSRLVTPHCSDARRWKILEGPVVIGGDNLPSPVQIGLTDLQNIGGASGPHGPTSSGITVEH